MIRFGPAGASDSFRAQGMKHTKDAPAWLRSLGLTAFEYSAGHGVQLGEETARAIGAEAQAHGIAVSIHAPYYINLAQADPEKAEGNQRWLCESAEAVRAMGGRRIVFHPGSPGKGDRAEAMGRAMRRLEEISDMPELEGMLLCPETAGRQSLLGSVEEIIALCSLRESILPTVDFAHMHAVRRIEGEGDCRRILDPLLHALGEERMRNFHVHFSHIEYTPKGEKRHRNFDDEGFGPDFLPLARVLVEYRLEPVVICESSGHQAEDAAEMQRVYAACAQATT